MGLGLPLNILFLDRYSLNNSIELCTFEITAHMEHGYCKRTPLSYTIRWRWLHPPSPVSQDRLALPAYAERRKTIREKRKVARLAVKHNPIIGRWNVAGGLVWLCFLGGIFLQSDTTCQPACKDRGRGRPRYIHYTYCLLFPTIYSHFVFFVTTHRLNMEVDFQSLLGFHVT